jgi:peptidoglycan/xylan/chitin deacetylase (PgdA/CDA1 family)
MYRRPAALGELGPIVTFTFDDFPRSALTVGGSILESFAVRATYYISMGLMNAENPLGQQFSREDLDSLVERGHEAAIHGFDHLSARETSGERFIADVLRCETTLHQSFPAGASSNFAYPYGHTTLSLKRRLGPQMSSSRGVIAGLNGPEADLNLLRANLLCGDVDEFEPVRQLMIENAARNSWLIFFSHDVDDDPSPYGCTPALLRQTVRFAVEQGASVLTVAEVVSALSPPEYFRGQLQDKPAPISVQRPG